MLASGKDPSLFPNNFCFESTGHLYKKKNVSAGRFYCADILS